MIGQPGITLRGGGISTLNNILFKIAIPSVVFSTLIYFPKRVLRGEGIDTVSLLHDTLLGGSLWFTCALTVAELVAFVVLLSRAKSILWYILVGVISVALANVINNTGFQIWESDKIPWQYKSGLIAFFFLACGGLYWKYEYVLEKIFFAEFRGKRAIVTILMIIVWGGLTGVLIYMRNQVTLRQINQQLTTGHINIISILWALFSIMAVINVCKLMKGNRLTSWVGRNSIAFYFFCGAIPNVFSIISAKLLPQFDGARMVLLVWTLSLVCAFGVVYLFSRYLPWAFDFRKIKNK